MRSRSASKDVADAADGTALANASLAAAAVSAAAAVTSGARRLSYEPILMDGMLRMRQAYESTDPDVLEELADIEDMVDGNAKAMCGILHRLAKKEGYDRYEDPVTGFGVYTADFLSQQDCCGHECRHCPHSHKNVPRNVSKAKVPHAAKKASAPRCSPPLPIVASTPPTHGSNDGASSKAEGNADSRSGYGRSQRKDASAADRCSRLLQQARAAMRTAEGEASRSSEGSRSSRSSKEAGGNSDGDSDGGSESSNESASASSASSSASSSDGDSMHDRSSAMPPQRSWPASFTEADLSDEARAEAESQRAEPLGFQRVLHREACRHGFDTYKDPPTGYTVFTARALQPRPCCGNGCRHCPHAHCNVPEYMRAAVSCTALLDDDWDW